MTSSLTDSHIDSVVRNSVTQVMSTRSLRDSLFLTYNTDHIRYHNYDIKMEFHDIYGLKKRLFTVSNMYTRTVYSDIAKLETVVRLIELLEKNRMLKVSQLLRVNEHYMCKLTECMHLHKIIEQTQDLDTYEIRRAKESHKASELDRITRDLLSF